MQYGGSAIHDRAFGFGPFSLYLAQKLLLEDGQPVRLGSRALAILSALIERAGEVVTKDELAAIVWPRTIVEESSLRVHVAALRKALGDGQAGARYIVNQPGRGYSFVAPVKRIPGRPQEPAVRQADTRFSRLPARLTRMIGRAESVALLAAQLKFGRFVTLVGPGGIGKTTMALAVAESHGAGFEDGVCYLDLAPVTDGHVIPSVLMAALRLSPRDETLASLETFLRERRLLIVFDNCEHLIDPLASLVERLLMCGPGVHVLATSREPMRAEGEWLHRVGALAVPPAGLALTAAEALRYAAIELFVERATASVDDFVLADGDAATVGALCRRLDGNPLAIELAAARVDLFGLPGLAAQLDAHLLQLKGDRRDAPPRHHSLSTMLDWSYRLLTDTERLVLTRLAVFQGWFPLRAATEFVLFVEPAGTLGEQQVFDAMADLTAKSLLASDTSGEVVQFRLLELTRAFAAAQLEQTGLRTRMAGRHAAHVMALVDQAAEDWTTGLKSEWFATHLWLIDEIRAALAWCFTREGDALTGCRMTARMWSLVNVINPFDRPDAIERALEALAQLPERHPAIEMRLNIALAAKYEYQDTRPGFASEVSARAVALAAEFDDPSFEAEALMAVCLVQMSMGQYTEATATRDRLSSAAHRSRNAVLMLVADRIGAQASHFAAANARCRLLAERVLSHPAPRGPMGTVGGGGLDHRVSMRIMLSRTLWIEGLADQAASLAEETFQLASGDDALAQLQALSLCLCPLALWRGDRQAAEQRIATFRTLLQSQKAGGVWLPSSALIPWWQSQAIDGSPNVLQRDHLMTAYGALVTPAAARRAESGATGWCTAEILRAWGERLLHENAPGAVETARGLFARALATAAEQQALAWELRAATSLARLLKEKLGRDGEARAVLEPVYRRFTEGFSTTDLRQAAALLER